MKLTGTSVLNKIIFFIHLECSAVFSFLDPTIRPDEHGLSAQRYSIALQ